MPLPPSLHALPPPPFEGIAQKVERRKEVSHMEPLVPTRGYTHRGERKKENQCFLHILLDFDFHNV